MEFKQQQFEDFFSSPEKIGASTEERVRRHCAGGGRVLVAFVWRRRDYGAPSGPAAVFLEAC
jgi:hypothetical protein